MGRKKTKDKGGFHGARAALCKHRHQSLNQEQADWPPAPLPAGRAQAKGGQYRGLYLIHLFPVISNHT